jgi:hypothetical protein
MHALEHLLAFRPANVVSRLGGGSRVPLLGLRELLGALEGRAPLLALPLPRRQALPGVLRAARFQDAVLGLALPHPLAERGAAERFAEAVRAAAEEAGHAQPLFLQAGPLPLPRGDRTAPSGVERCLEAGFTLVTLDAGRRGGEAPGALAADVAELAAPVLARELTVELTLPLTAAPPSPDALRAQLDALSAVRALPQLLRLEARQVSAGGGPVEPAWVEPLREVAAQFGVLLSGADTGDGGPDAVGGWRAPGLRKVELSAPSARLALAGLEAAQRRGLEARARGAGLSAAEVFALVEPKLPPLAEAEAGRLEARAFAEVVDLLGTLGLAGSARRVSDALADAAD